MEDESNAAKRRLVGQECLANPACDDRAIIDLPSVDACGLTPAGQYLSPLVASQPLPTGL